MVVKVFAKKSFAEPIYQISINWWTTCVYSTVRSKPHFGTLLSWKWPLLGNGTALLWDFIVGTLFKSCSKMTFLSEHMISFKSSDKFSVILFDIIYNAYNMLHIICSVFKCIILNRLNETDLINIIQDDILSDFDIQQKQNEYLKAWERVSNQCSINGIDSINEHKVCLYSINVYTVLFMRY